MSGYIDSASMKSMFGSLKLDLLRSEESCLKYSALPRVSDVLVRRENGSVSINKPPDLLSMGDCDGEDVSVEISGSNMRGGGRIAFSVGKGDLRGDIGRQVCGVGTVEGICGFFLDADVRMSYWITQRLN